MTKLCINGWKSYLADYNKDPSILDSRWSLPSTAIGGGNDTGTNGNDINDILADYKILDGNADDQATTSELKSFIDGQRLRQFLEL